MAKQRLNHDEAFQKLMGIPNSTNNDTPSEAETTPDGEKTVPATPPSARESKEKNKPTAFYITDKHRKALKIKAAMSDRPEDKDQSAIVRSALDIYLADILKNL